MAGSVLLNGARLGGNAHVRPGTLLEEQASTAHAVGLKQTILLAYVTVGSLVNLCDALVSGGRSRSQHTEIGSGFIHFNYTPYGPEGDKATPTLIGDVERGVFLREDQVFIGGLSGIVGPRKIGFGALTVAGQIIREDVTDNLIYSSLGRTINKVFSRTRTQLPSTKVATNVDFIGQLFALKAWYSRVRLERALRNRGLQSVDYTLINEAISTIQDCIDERVLRLNALLVSFGHHPQSFEADLGECPIIIDQNSSGKSYLDWLGNLSPRDVSAGQGWLHRVSSSIRLKQSPK
jgi:UDP-N-acetylglucosamine/UDP-N-acetylgalactosamine diphosphorylase